MACSSAGAVIGAGVTLTGRRGCTTSCGTGAHRDARGAARGPGPGRSSSPAREPWQGAFAGAHGLSRAVALLVKDRDPGTDARVAHGGRAALIGRDCDRRAMYGERVMRARTTPA